MSDIRSVRVTLPLIIGPPVSHTTPTLLIVTKRVYLHYARARRILTNLC